jgi:hypothetical protein
MWTNPVRPVLTKNQKGDTVQSFTPKLIVPRRPGMKPKMNSD